MKRGFTKTEAMTYLGVKRRFFDENLMPYLKGKAVKAGPALIFDKKDLDAAWDSYKLGACGSERARSKDERTCDVQYLEASTKPKTVPLRLIPSSRNNAFESVVSELLKKQRNS